MNDAPATNVTNGSNGMNIMDAPNTTNAPEVHQALRTLTALRLGEVVPEQHLHAVHLRFDIGASSLPDEVKEKLRALRDQRISSDGIIVIKAQKHRSLERNREDGLVRLRELIASAAFVPAVRRPTKPSRNSQRKRIESKIKRGQVKLQRGRVVE